MSLRAPGHSALPPTSGSFASALASAWNRARLLLRSTRGSRLVRTVLLGPSLVGTVLLGPGLVGTALLGPGLVGNALLGPGLVGTVLLGPGLVGTALLGPTLVGTALLGPTLVGAVLLSGCSGEVGAPATGASDDSSTTVQGLQNQPLPSFLARMPNAPERIAHSGLRRVEYHVDFDGAPTSLVYDERVTADGAGRYSIETVAVQAPSMTQPQRDHFEILQSVRQGFFFKYRDLRVRDLDLFLANYSVHVIAGAPIVAGIECVEIQVDARHDSTRSYRLAVDADSGLVMSSVERDGNGAVIASTMFLEFTRAPVLDGFVAHVERYPGTPVESAALPPGFTPARPQILPMGYREMSSEVLQLLGDTYVRRVYGDGFENVFFLQRQRPASPIGNPADPAASVVVRMAQLGSFRVAEAQRGGGNFFVVGKVSEADVLDILRSAL